MSLREKMNQNPKVSIAITIPVIVLALGLIFYFGLSGPGNADMGAGPFYSSDDGKTTFRSEPNQLSPIDVDGKTAVRAYVFTCDEGKTSFVAYLERYTPDARQKILAARQARTVDELPENVTVDGLEVKTPGGDGRWTKAASPEGRAVMTVKCPGGGGTPLTVE